MTIRQNIKYSPLFLAVLWSSLFFTLLLIQPVHGEMFKLNETERTTWHLELPITIFDESIEGWMVDRFAGNSTAGSKFYQGPAKEVGGLQRPDQCVEGENGIIYLVCGLMTADTKRLITITPDGKLRLIMEMDGAVEGPMAACQAGYPIWNPKEKTLYLTGPNCLRKVTKKPDGSRWVTVMAGIPGKGPKRGKKHRNGPALKATFQSLYRGVVCNSKGVFFWLEDNGLRRIENGRVSSVPLKHLEEPKKMYFAMAQNLLSMGENDDTLYISDFYNPGYRVLRCNVNTGELKWVCGINRMKEKKFRPKEKRRGGLEADGPALTHAGANSGMRGLYTKYYNAIWVSGPDHMRLRWLRLDGDGWVRTVFGARRTDTPRKRLGIQELNAAGIPGEQFTMNKCRLSGVDSQGGLYISAWEDKSGVWRAYNHGAVHK
ncbi:hypothetical protein [Desulfobacter sp. UBA2225]|uniref:hypothetical protein n=1 Tax=Desulfobacter sp. UBA2225 TaxID=1961413 RepID=UPI002579DA8B|nr:hypothetical protein [Desulfobacter sp. UBA2225]